MADAEGRAAPLPTYALLAASVAGMAITMLAHGDSDSSVPTVVAFVCIAATFTALAVALYRPLFARQAGAPQPATTLGAKEEIR